MVYLKVLRFNDIKQTFSHLLFRGDNYLVIEILNHHVQLTVLKANFDKKKILILRNIIEPVQDFSAPAVLAKLKLMLKGVRRLEKYKLILSLDSDFAATIYASIPLVRLHPKETIDEADLDNLISQAIWRFFDRNRLRVSRKLDIDEVDVILSNVKIRGIKLDGHKIVNPMGFKAKSVEVFFSQTLVGRDLMRGLYELISREKVALITESGVAMSHILSQTQKKKDFFVANLFPSHTAVFSASTKRLRHHDSFEWGEKHLNESLVGHFGVDHDIAGLMIKKYIAQSASRNFLRRFETVLSRELHTFARGLESLIDEDSSDIYLNSFFDVPPLLFSDRFQNKFQKSFRLSPLSTNLITEKLGYDVQYKKTVKVRNLFSVLSAFFEINFLPQNNKMSHLANRRVRWLVT